QIPEAIAPNNGDLIRLAPGAPEVIDEVPAGRLFVDGGVMIDADDDALKDRRRLGAEGSVHIALALNAKHAILAGPNVNVRGLAMADEEEFELALEELEQAAEAAYQKLSHSDRDDDDTVEANLMRAVRRTAERLWGKRPLVDVTV